MVTVSLMNTKENKEKQLKFVEKQIFTEVNIIQSVWPELRRRLTEAGTSSGFLGAVQSFYKWYQSDVVPQINQVKGTFKVLVGSEVQVGTGGSLVYKSLKDHESISQIFSTCASAERVADDLSAKRWLASLANLENIDVTTLNEISLTKVETELDVPVVNSIDAYAFYSLLGINPMYDVGQNSVYSLIIPKQLSSGAIDFNVSKTVLSVFGIEEQDSLRTARFKVTEDAKVDEVASLLNKEGRTRWLSAAILASQDDLDEVTRNWILTFKTGIDDVIKYLPPSDDVIYRGIDQLVIRYVGYPIWNVLEGSEEGV